MKIKELIKQDEGLRYAVDSMEFMSSAGHRYALETNFETDAEGLEAEWRRTSRAVACLECSSESQPFKDLMHCLMQLHDVRSTLASLAAGIELSEVELFEVKHLAFISDKARTAIGGLDLTDILPLPDLSGVFSLLDPDHSGVDHFYIYDSYHPRLASLRQQLNGMQDKEDAASGAAELFDEIRRIEQQVCTTLCDGLKQYSSNAIKSMEQMAYADFLLAKARLCEQWGLARPVVGSQLSLEGLFNPRLKHHNEQVGARYQPVDIAACAGATLITGANMAGKTVLLKSIATAQLMVQCGFFAPAAKAVVPLFGGLEMSVGDGQNEMNGLSSYASEMVRISQILEQSRRQRMLVLIDEPARTTNPVEGKALVEALVEICQRSESTALITTHYSGLGNHCRRLRVKGFREGLSASRLSPMTINQFIDYSLEEDLDGDAPQEALRIAALLGCDAELIEIAKQKYQQSKHTQL